MKIIESLKLFYAQYICTAANIIYKKVTKKRFHYKKIQNRPIIPAGKANELIAEAIREGKPYMIGRYGSIELKAMIDALAVEVGLRKQMRENVMGPFCNNAGFFPKDKNLALRFGLEMKEWSRQVDMMCMWVHTGGAKYAIKNYAKNAKLIQAASMEPYYFINPWSKELKGKKVLVIHPLAETIKAQYLKREKLFPNPETLPEFELKTVKAVQSIGGVCDEFSDWFQALDYMKSEIDKQDFDVALIGCGAYGFALAAYVKQKGKVAIHIGGALQLLFGIKGGRWVNHPDHYPYLHQIFNEHWVFPAKEDVPAAAKSVENSCYW